MILKISLGQGLAKDKLVWPHVSVGVYTVKSGYNFLSKQRASESKTSPNPCPYQKVWKQVWNHAVPSKVKSFLWRASKNSLPIELIWFSGIFLLKIPMNCSIIDQRI